MAVKQGTHVIAYLNDSITVLPYVVVKWSMGYLIGRPSAGPGLHCNTCPHGLSQAFQGLSQPLRDPMFCFLPHWVTPSLGPMFPPHRVLVGLGPVSQVWVPHPTPPCITDWSFTFSVYLFLEVALPLCDFSTQWRPCGSILEVGTLVRVAAMSCGCTKMVPASGTVPHSLQAGQGAV